MKFKEFFLGKSTQNISMCDDPNFKKYNIGRWTYGSPNILSWDDKTQLTIGKYCSIADGVTFILGGEHRSDWISTYPFSEFFGEGKAIEGHPASKGDIVIGNDVWIGQNASILSGVKIGDGAIVGAYSVVSKDVAAYTIVAGNPARTIRTRFDEKSITALLEACWWELPDEQIRKLIPKLLSSDVDDLLRAINSGDSETGSQEYS